MVGETKSGEDQQNKLGTGAPEEEGQGDASEGQGEAPQGRQGDPNDEAPSWPDDSRAIIPNRLLARSHDMDFTFCREKRRSVEMGRQVTIGGSFVRSQSI